MLARVKQVNTVCKYKTPHSQFSLILISDHSKIIFTHTSSFVFNSERKQEKQKDKQNPPKTSEVVLAFKRHQDVF